MSNGWIMEPAFDDGLNRRLAEAGHNIDFGATPGPPENVCDIDPEGAENEQQSHAAGEAPEAQTDCPEPQGDAQVRDAHDGPVGGQELGEGDEEAPAGSEGGSSPQAEAA